MKTILSILPILIFFSIITHQIHSHTHIHNKNHPLCSIELIKKAQQLELKTKISSLSYQEEFFENPPPFSYQYKISRPLLPIKRKLNLYLCKDPAIRVLFKHVCYEFYKPYFLQDIQNLQKALNQIFSALEQIDYEQDNWESLYKLVDHPAPSALPLTKKLLKPSFYSSFPPLESICFFQKFPEKDLSLNLFNAPVSILKNILSCSDFQNLENKYREIEHLKKTNSQALRGIGFSSFLKNEISLEHYPIKFDFYKGYKIESQDHYHDPCLLLKVKTKQNVYFTRYLYPL